MKSIFLLLILLSLQEKIMNDSHKCHDQCKECFEKSEDNNNMKCKSCKNEGYFLLYNTTNCVDEGLFSDYYKNPINESIILYPCSLYSESNCYECNPFKKSIDEGICISCKFGYFYNNKNKKCAKCREGQLSLVLSDFDGCDIDAFYQYCDKYVTTCYDIENFNNFECPNYAPIFNNITKTCSEMDCPEEGFKNGECQIKIPKYKDRILFINWFKGTMLRYPSYNNDNSGFLLIEFTPNIEFIPKQLLLISKDQRQLFFYNNEGRGCFDEVNDVYNKLVNLEKEYFRFFSTSVAIKVNDEDKYKYLLNFEYYEGNMELINLQTGEISFKNFFSLNTNTIKYDFGESSHAFPIMFLSETNEKNVYLLGFFIRTFKSQEEGIAGIYLFLFNFISPNEKSVITIDSINIIRAQPVLLNLSEDSKSSCIQTKEGYFILTIVDIRNTLVTISLDSEIRGDIIAIETNKVIPNTFLKRVFLKDEKSMVLYHTLSGNNIIMAICVQDYRITMFENLIHEGVYTDLSDGVMYYAMDMIALSESRVIILSQQLHGREIIIYILDFLKDYTIYVKTTFYINIINQKMHVSMRYSLIFKYKDTLGLQFENMNGENGFIIFGYFNSTDPVQIYNIKKDGLNYSIKLNKYLFLQSNIFGYEIRGIKIISVPEINITGLYFISNITKKEVKSNDIIDYNSEITLYFSRDI